MPIRHINNGDGSVTQVDADTGQELVTFLDSDGSYTRDVLEPAAASQQQARPQGSNAERTFAKALELSPKQTVMPETTKVAPEPPLSDFGRALKPPAPASQAAAMQPAGASMATQRLPLVQTQEEGLAPADLDARRTARQHVGAAEQQANIATTEAEQAELAARETRVQAESDRALGGYAADLETHELAKKSVLDAEAAAQQARAAPIEPGQALAGDKFFFAILANVGAALSNFGSALLGQQGTQDTNVVDDLIRQSVAQQMAQKQLNVEATSADLDHHRSESARLEMRANASLEKWFLSRAAVEKSPELAAQYRANAEQRGAAIKRSQFELAESEYTREVKTRAVPKPAAGAGAGGKAELPVNPETAEERAVLAANGVDDKAYRKYTDERLKTGADVFISSADAADQVIKQFAKGQDVPGSGPLDKLLQPAFREGDAAAVQQTTGMLTAQFGKLISGASMQEGERKMLQGLIEGRGTLDDWKRGINMLRRHAGTQLETLDNGYSGEARSFGAIQDMRKGRRTVTDEQAARRDAQLKPKDGAQVVSKDAAGKEYYESPEAKRRREAREARERQPRRGSAGDRARIAQGLGLDED